MAAPRFYLPTAQQEHLQTSLFLPEEEAHHARDVLRLATGDAVTIFNGSGGLAKAQVDSISKQSVSVVLTHWTTEPAPATRTALAQAIPKGKTMEWIIEKAVELGVRQIYPLITGRTIVRLDAGEAKQKQQKWQRIAIEACKQCGQNWLPEVSKPQSYGQFLESTKNVYTQQLIAAISPEAVHLKQHLSQLSSAATSSVFLVGPEGDFTPQELTAALHSGYQPVSLGRIILRSETAALYVMSLLHEG